ncbi:MAG TPA: glycosyltransferase [Pyrinomonadaceae bacterium]|nr:glycosyltransferase [Pyrinomonadaceae bacterium]
MKKKVLVFFPENLYPSQSGFHKRGMEMLWGWREQGCEITLASSELTAFNKWTPESIEHLRAKYLSDFRLHRPTYTDHKFRDLLQKYHLRRSKHVPPLSAMHSPPGLRRWFTRQLGEVAPDIVMINYAYWDGLLNHRKFKSITRVSETIDLLTLSLRMWRALEKHLPPPPIEASAVSDEVLQEDFFEKLNLQADAEEFRVYDRYDYTIAISRHDEELMRRNTQRTNVLYIPMTQEPCRLANDYSGNALLTTGPNPFNLQGYFYFVKRVLPSVRRSVPDFRLQVTGYCCERVVGVEGVELSGFVTDLKPVYQASRFLVCPIFGGTGQQVKIVEAMAHGVPVVALRQAAEKSPIRHGENGLVANGAEEFAAHVTRLWNDPELCRRLGDNARDTVANEFSRARLVESLSRIVDAA